VGLVTGAPTEIEVGLSAVEEWVEKSNRV